LRPAFDFFPQALLLDAGRLAAAGSTEEVLFGPALAVAFGVRVERAVHVCFQPVDRIDP
jgi:ABC-type cobalamin transport system ATPase subunit